MLEKIDLSRKLEKDEFKSVAPALRERLGELQREARNAGVPVMIAFEGWEASGKGTLINELIMPLDPRGFRVFYVGEGTAESRYWPPLLRFWEMTPARGHIGIYSKSWYRTILEDHDGVVAFEDLVSFERQLASDDNLIIKFFVHISKKEQRKRLKKMDRDESSAWRVSAREWADNDNYDENIRVVEEMILKTDREFAPWTIVEAHDKNYAIVKILDTVVRSLERHLARVADQRRLRSEAKAAAARTCEPGGDECAAAEPKTDPLAPSILKNIDLTKTIEPDEYKDRLGELQRELREIQHHLYRVRRPLVIVFEGQDAAGKGGCIKRLTQKLDPRGYQVSPTSSPNDIERAHHYLWRFWTAFPKAGHVGIYDRSWYGRVLVERVEGFCSEQEWRRAYAEINEMESQWARYGAIILKFWLQVDSAEQLARFTDRQNNPDKNWKITEEDWRNRDKWPQYEEAAEEMMLRTSTPHAPWIIVEANSKEYARIKVLRETAEAAKRALG